MHKYKTVTASAGHMFRITSTNGSGTVHATEYLDEGPLGYCRFTPRHGGCAYTWDNPIIELVEIPKPESEPSDAGMALGTAAMTWMGCRLYVASTGNATIDKEVRRLLMEALAPEPDQVPIMLCPCCGHQVGSGAGGAS